MELLRWTAEYLGGKGFHNPRLNGELLLAGTLKLKRLDLYLQYDRPLRPDELAEFKARLRRRARREPLQYIEGEAHFRDLVLRVDGRVLIPRPETELLVQRVIDWAAGRPGLAAADVGTGSGAIALSLAAEGAFERVVATDVEAGALEAARANHAAAAPDAPVEFRLGDGLAPLAGDRFDAVVSNPPYIATGERSSLDPEVSEWEPAAALFGGADGLAIIRPLVAGAAGVLRPGGLLALEIGAAQGPAVAELVRAAGRFGEPRVEKDLAGRDRFVLAELRTSTD
ncbi:MAG TPA: peptide chain release factor N(5)-glutamine methyltransferase [Longimicrobium sp.]|nr:peptide chain release factor N(5)-glutamine methyltransferase [Longimicrobium sp.]